MFLRKLISTSLVMSVSIGSSIAVGAAYSKDLLRINTEGLEEGTCVVFVPAAPTHQSSPSIEDLHSRLLSFFVIMNNSYDGVEFPFYSNTRLDDVLQKRAQKAERNAQQKAQRKALRRVTQSFKPSAKSRHQH